MGEISGMVFGDVFQLGGCNLFLGLPGFVTIMSLPCDFS